MEINETLAIPDVLPSLFDDWREIVGNMSNLALAPPMHALTTFKPPEGTYTPYSVRSSSNRVTGSYGHTRPQTRKAS
jgi:hypothetical protein